MSRKAYDKGFDVIMEDIINKYADNPRSTKRSIHQLNKLFLAVTSQHLLGYLYEKLREDIQKESNLKIKNLKLDCIKRLHFRTLNKIKTENFLNNKK